MSMITRPSRLIDEDLHRRMKAAFAPKPITPKSDPREVFFHAGQQEVMQWLENQLTVKTVSGNPTDLKG